jgi:hypothetical protein
MSRNRFQISQGHYRIGKKVEEGWGHFS